MNRRSQIRTRVEKIDKTMDSMIPFLFILFILADVFLFPLSSDVRIFVLLGLYGFSIFRYKIRSTTTFTVALVLLVVSYIQFLSTDQIRFDDPGPVPPLAERTAVWLYLVMMIGVIQKWRE